MFLYSVARFAIEYFRGDSARGLVAITETLALSTSQVVAVVLVLAVALVVPYLMKTQRLGSAPVAA